jgi:hypothetical protein
MVKVKAKVCLELRDAIKLRDPFLMLIAFIICRLGYGGTDNQVETDAVV